jgi:two-component system, chemotaxis family, sensor kinase Cph1
MLPDPTEADGPVVLDDLPEEKLRELDYAAVKLDGRGLVLFHGGEGDGEAGRDFFREVAPGTNIPAFRGRFMEGVRSGHLDEAFDFVVTSGADAPLRARIRMSASREPGRYWITIQPLERLEPDRPAVARHVVESRIEARDLDTAICALEPIHIPGKVQAPGILLAADPATLEVAAASANAEEAFGMPVAAVLGRRLGDLLGPELGSELAGRAAAGIPGRHPLRRRLLLGLPARPFEAAAHVQAGNLLVELEPAPSALDFPVPSQDDLQKAVARLRDAGSLDDLGRAAAEETRRLTGFERVVIYRFDHEWNGEALAEDVAADWIPLQGLHFPASDIPSQARDLYTRNRIRFVTDRDAVPSPLVAPPLKGPAGDAAGAGRPIDLTYAQFRSLSPIHLEYQRNLGVNGSMSASILTGGGGDMRLWGLLIGHHRKPHYVAPETRAAIRSLADMFALKLHELENRQVWDRQQDHLHVQSRLLCQMAGADDWVSTLTAGETTMLDLFDATGAAVVAAGEVTAIGETPDRADLLLLVDRLRGQRFEDRVFVTDRLSQAVGEAQAYRRVGSGLLAAAVDEARDDMLLWFRKEVVSTVAWGGNPHDTVIEEGGTVMVLPRRSFERWMEERRGYSLPWPTWQAEIARTLTRAIGDVILRHQRKVRQLRDKQHALSEVVHQKEALLRQKDLLAREIDHRVKNSLQIVASLLQMQRRTVRDEEARQAFAEAYGRVMGISRVHQSLYQSADAREVDLGQTIRSLCEDLAAMAGPRRHLDVKAEPGLLVDSAVALSLALVTAELVTNAFKYAYDERAEGRVEVGVDRLPGGGLKVVVADWGHGLPPDWLEREHRGLGMQVVRGMLERIGGSLETVSDGGTRFTVLVP